jgi:acetyl-CoA C-acetyltransferase
MNTTEIKRVAIIGGNRTPFTRSNKEYAKANNSQMLTAALQGLVERYDLANKEIGEVAAGAVMKHARDFNLTREAVLDTELSPYTPACDLQQACATGLQAATYIANKIALGQIESGIAAGTDTTSDAPITLNENFRTLILDASRQKTTGDKLKMLAKFRPKHLIPAIPKNGEPRTGLAMGDHAQITAHEWNISRQAQDELAAQSHANLANAYENGFFEDLITPYNGLSQDGLLRPDSTVEKLSTLKPCFDKKNGTMTAGNSTALSDGASSVLMASEEWANANNLPIRAYMTHSETSAIDFVTKKEGLLMAPAYAVPRMLEKANLTLQDFDFYEIHEAFASQVLATLAAWESDEFCINRLGLTSPLGSIDRNKLNVKGSSLSVGHPFAATGARIIATLAKILEENGGGRGLISICAAGGQGVTAILER